MKYHLVRPNSSAGKWREACFKVLTLYCCISWLWESISHWAIWGVLTTHSYFGGSHLPEKNKSCNMNTKKILLIYCDQMSVLAVILKSLQLYLSLNVNFPKCAPILTTLIMEYLILKVHTFYICEKHIYTHSFYPGIL